MMPAPRPVFGLHPEAVRFVLPLWVLAATVAWFVAPWTWVASAVVVALSLAVALFFRDPRRVPPTDDHVVVAPADGVVCAVLPGASLPEGLAADGEWTRVSIYMSVLNVHVNRAPIAGRVVAVAYRPGRFAHAASDAASETNERHAMLLRTAVGEHIVVAQIAGRVARRIVCHARIGDDVALGERFGLIRFGSRLDVYLPTAGFRVMATTGLRTRAGETVMAMRPGQE